MIGPTEILVILAVLVLGVVGLGVSIWALVDAATKPASAWQAAGQSQTVWIVLLVVSLLVGLGIILGLVYLLAIRPKLA